MGFDRRMVVMGMGMTLATSCARAGQRGNGAMNGNVDWPTFKAAFLDPEGRIIDNGNGGISHSEGQSYGLLLALGYNDRDGFEHILNWTERTLAQADTGLFRWRYDPRAADPVADPNNATDGDIMIAWALAEAARQWRVPAYAQRSAAIRAAIRSRLVLERHGRLLLLPGMTGFVQDKAVTLNPSYYLWPALDAFARLDGRQAWGQVIEDGEALMALAGFGPLGLPTDWIDVTGHDALAPAAGRPARFGFDAIRVPLYAKAGKRAALLNPVRTFWQGYATSGRPIPAWVDVLSGEVAPYALSAGGEAIAARVMGTAAPTTLSPDYYAASLQMLATRLG